jgi:TRAP-type C4-dicarboxylate transport system permease large subunit
MALLAGVLGAAVARMAGNVTGLFHDGDTLEWPVCTAIALIAVAATVGLLSRR